MTQSRTPRESTHGSIVYCSDVFACIVFTTQFNT